CTVSLHPGAAGGHHPRLRSGPALLAARLQRFEWAVRGTCAHQPGCGPAGLLHAACAPGQPPTLGRPLRSGRSAMIGLGPRVAMVALTASLLGCGPHVLEPETWMVGTFSGAVAQLGCTASDVVYRYIVHQDGRFDVIKESGYSGIYAEHHAQ